MLSKKKKCGECSSPIEEDWEFCPRCGELLEAEDLFEDVFDDMEKRFGNMERLFQFPEISFQKGSDSGGISISIVSGTGIEPKVSIQTSGKFRELEPEIRKQFGITAAKPTVQNRMETKQRKVKFEKTEEPEMKVKKGKNEISYTISLPGIVSVRSVDVKKLPNSIEIRAAAGNKLYFKLFEVPEGFSLMEKSFKDRALFLTLKRQ